MKEVPKHYDMAIQPIDFIVANQIPFIEGNVIKYVCRWREKGGLQDLKKAISYLEYLVDGYERKQIKE